MCIYVFLKFRFEGCGRRAPYKCLNEIRLQSPISCGLRSLCMKRDVLVDIDDTLPGKCCRHTRKVEEKQSPLDVWMDTRGSCKESVVAAYLASRHYVEYGQFDIENPRPALERLRQDLRKVERAVLAGGYLEDPGSQSSLRKGDVGSRTRQVGQWTNGTSRSKEQRGECCTVM